MATINSVNNTLTGATGTGSFVGSISPTLTGDVDASSATTFAIPSSSSPTLNSVGQIALDSNVTDYTPMIKYDDGTNDFVVIAMPTANLTTTNNSVISYNATNDEFEMVVPSGGAGKLLQVVVGTLSSDFSTTSATPVSTGLSASITPANSSNIIVIEVYGSLTADKTGGGSILQRYAFIQIERTAPSSSTLSTAAAGRDRLSASGANLPSYWPVIMGYSESAGSTSVHTYRLNTYVPDTRITSTIQGTVKPSLIILYELGV